jgi:catalase
MKFPDMVHALKPNPKNHIQEDWRILDFFSHHPESLHMFTFLFDDIGIPADYRHMDGSGVNTYTLISKEGKAHYVKFHWKPTCGVKSLLDEEAVIVGGMFLLLSVYANTEFCRSKELNVGLLRKLEFSSVLWE